MAISMSAIFTTSLTNQVSVRDLICSHSVKGSFTCTPFLTGLYFTCDWVYRDIDGDYYVVGRQDDIIRIKGVWIQVPEIESSIAVST